MGAEVGARRSTDPDETQHSSTFTRDAGRADPPPELDAVSWSVHCPPPKPDTMPARLGRYAIRQQLGIGGMGVVYLAHDYELDREVAIKVVKEANRGGASVQQERLLREARAMAKLAHPNVVTIHDVGILGDTVFVAMEWVRGVTLKRWLRERRRTWSEILPHFVAAARGLAAVHGAGLVHRDFKPSNVLLDDDGTVKVADFGLVQGPDGWAPNDGPDGVENREDRVVGTRGFMSPEQLRGEVVDGRSDIFSFCVALHEALHGRLPFAGTSGAELLDAIDAGVRSPLDPDVPRRIDAIAARGLAADPERRWQTMDEILAALTEVSTPRGRRQLALVLALAIVLTMTITALVTASVLTGASDEPGSASSGTDDLGAPSVEHPPAREPILHWSFDEGAGELVHDGADPRVVARITGGARWTDEVAPIPVPNPAALRLDGIDDHVLHPSAEFADFDHDEDFTIALWIKPAPVQPDVDEIDNDIIDKWAEGTGFPYAIRYTNRTGVARSVGRITCSRFEARNHADLTSRKRVDDGRFHHVAFVKRGARLFLYMDGELEDTVEDATRASTKTIGHFNVGRRMYGANHFAGVVDDLFVYERGLSATEVNALRQRGG